MATVRYIGPHDAVDIKVNEVWTTVDRGGTLEVDDATATSLLTQVGNWAAVPSEKSGKPGK